MRTAYDNYNASLVSGSPSVLGLRQALLTDARLGIVGRRSIWLLICLLLSLVDLRAATPVPPSPDLRLSMYASPGMAGTGPFTWIAKVRNQGRVGAEGVLLHNPTADGMILLAATASQGQCQLSNGVVWCDLGSIAPAATVVVTITAQATMAGGRLTNTARVLSTGLEPRLGNNIAFAFKRVMDPSVLIEDVSASEGDGESGHSMIFQPRLSMPSRRQVSVHYSTLDGTARAGRDYVRSAGKIRFPPFTTNQPLAISLLGNDTPGSNRTFSIRLSSPVNARVEDRKATGTIVEDEFIPITLNAPALDHWVWRLPQPQGNNFTAVTHGNGRYVAVTEGDTVVVSTNSRDWESHAIPMLRGFQNWRMEDVAFGNGRFVASVNATASSPGIPPVEVSFTLSSEDGVSWVSHSDAKLGRVFGPLDFAHDAFFSGAGTSSDGLVWSAVESVTGFVSATYGGNKYILTDGYKIWSSENGVQFDFASVLPGVRELAFGNGVFVAATEFYDREDRDWYSSLHTSVDGHTWTLRTGMEERIPREGHRLAFGSGRLIHITSSGVVILTRDDSPEYAPLPQADEITGVTGDFGFVAVGRSGAILRSGDGRTWMEQTVVTRDNLRDLARGPDRYVAVGNDGMIITSTDGVDWSPSEPIAKQNLRAVAWGAGRFVAAGEKGLLATSPDGITWSTNYWTEPLDFYGLTFAENTFVVVGEYGVIMTSPNGENWLMVHGGDSRRLSGIAYGGGLFVATGESIMFTSSNLLNWSSGIFFSGLDLESVAYGNGIFVAAGPPGAILTSQDGASWTLAPQLASFEFEKVSFGNGQFVVVGNDGAILSSQDGLAWQKHFSGTSHRNFRSVVYADNRWTVVGNNGTILQSGDGTFEVTTPFIVLQPEPQQVHEGSTAELHVIAVSSGPMTYQWRRNGTPLPASTNNILTFASTLSDDGFYSVVVSNAAGMVLSRTVRLIVFGPDEGPPEFVLTPESQEAWMGDDVPLTSQIHGSPPLHYQWSFNGETMPHATNATLELSSVTLTNAGFYEVTVTNEFGAASSLAVLKVGPAASIRIQFAGADLFLGQTATLSAEVIPRSAQLQWQHDGLESPGATNLALTLANLSLSDAGNYQVVLSLEGRRYTSSPALLPLQTSLRQAWNREGVVQKDLLGNIYLVTKTNLTKYNPQGQPVWETTRTGGSLPLGLIDTNGDTVLVNWERTEKLDRSGNRLWQTLGGEKATLDRAGNVYVTGFGTQKYDSTGRLLWDVPEIRGEFIAITQDGDVYLSRVSYSAANRRQITVTKLAPNGSWVWEQRHSDLYESYPTAITVDADGGVLVSGPSLYDFDTSPFGTGSFFTTLRYAPTGECLWVAESPAFGVSSAMYGDMPSHLAVDADGRVTVAGAISAAPCNDFRAAFNCSLDIGLIQYDSSGQELWRSSYQGYSDSGAATAEGPISLSVDSEGDSYICGWGMLAKHDPHGDRLWTFHPFDPQSVVSDAAGHVYLTWRDTNLVFRTIRYEQLPAPDLPHVLVAPQISGGTSRWDLAVVPLEPGPFHYQWLSNGLPIAPASLNPNLTLSNGMSQPTKFSVRVSNSAGAVVSQEARYRSHTPPGPVLSIGDVTLREGDTGYLPFVFPITLSEPAAQTVSATVVARTDYSLLLTNVVVIFLPGETSNTVTVLIPNDTAVSADRQFYVYSAFDGVTNATFGRAGRGIVLNNDGFPTGDNRPGLAIRDAAVAESDGASALFELLLTHPYGFPVSVDFTTVDGTARAGADYVARSGRMEFPPGTTRLTLPITILADRALEPAETFTVRLSAVGDAVLRNNEAIGTIVDSPFVSLDEAELTVAEGDSPHQILLHATLSQPSTAPIAVGCATRNVTAVGNSDYEPISRQLLFAPGTTNVEFALKIEGDSSLEPDETFEVLLCCGTNAVTGGAKATVTLRNDDEETSNDNFAQARSLTGHNATAFGANESATKETDEPSHAGNVGGHSLWWTWAASASGMFTLSTEGSSFDTLASVYTGDGLASLLPVAANDNDGTNQTSRVVFNAIAGREYLIAIDGAGGATGIVQLSLELNEGRFVPSSQARADAWIPDGPVHALLETNGVIYMGGRFRHLRRNNSQGLAIDLDSNESIPGFPAIEGDIFAATTDGAGGWYIGGRFSRAGGLQCSNLAHILPDFSIDPAWRPSANAEVRALLLHQGVVYVGGAFRFINGQAHHYLAALNPATGETELWSVVFNGAVHGLAAIGDTLYCHGLFSNIDGQSRRGVARVTTGGTLLPWNPPLANARIRTMAASCDGVFLGGETSSGARAVLVKVDPTSGQLLSWQPPVEFDLYTNQVINSLFLSDNRIFVGGRFHVDSPEKRENLAAFNVTDASLSLWKPDPVGGLVSMLSVFGQAVYVAGTFTNVGGASRDGLAAVDATLGAAMPWNVEYAGTLGVFAASGRSLYLAGLFDSRGARPRRSLAAIDARTGEPTDWNPHVTIEAIDFQAIDEAEVFALAMAPGALYVGGRFDSIGGLRRRNLAAVDPATGLGFSWLPEDGYAASFQVNAAAADTERAYFANNTFVIALGLSDHRRLWVSGTTANTGCSNLTLGASSLYVAGNFTSINGQFRRGLAALDPASGAVRSWNAAGNSTTRSLALMDDTLFVGGDFTFIGGGVHFGVAALDPATAAARAWNPGADGVFRTLATDGNLVFAAGTFNRIGGLTRRGLAAIEVGSAAPTAWNPDVAANAVRTISAGSAVALAGTFLEVSGNHQPYLALFAPVGAPVITSQPSDGVVNVGESFALEARLDGQAPITLQWQHNGTNLPGASQPRLLLNHIQPAASGDYVLVASNGLGLVVSKSALVKVVQYPAILAQPQSLVVTAGDAADLTVTASGVPAPRYQWRRNGVNIPNANAATLPLPNVQPTDGGSYTVVIANLAGVLESEVATVEIENAPLPFADTIAAAGILSQSQGRGNGINVAATGEPGEPLHAGKPGGHSLWLTWIAPANGIATFSTRGSTFDTLLGIYTGNAPSSLVEVVSDEDRGGFLTSSASFNAVANVPYRIAVDGFAGAVGHIVLTWSLDTSVSPFPRIIQQPISQSVSAGATARFAVDVNSASPVTYQWYFGCQLIPGATNAILELSNVQRSRIGGYRVQIMNASSRMAESDEATLEIGPEPKIVSHDKLEDLLARQNPGLFGPFVPTVNSTAFVSVPAGGINSQLLNNQGSTTQLGEPSPCGVMGGASRWFGLKALDAGVFQIDTIGSTIDTVMAVYFRTNLSKLAANLVACDNDGAPDHVRSLVRFSAQPGREYLIAVDGVNGAQGLISLNWRLGTPMLLGAVPTNQIVRAGQTVSLQVGVSNLTPDVSYQWWHNGKLLAGATNAVLHLPEVAASRAGSYVVSVSNFTGIVTAPAAVVTVEQPYLRLESGPSGTIRLWLPPVETPPFVLEFLSDFTELQWRPLESIVTTNATGYLEIPAEGPSRFFRARPR